MKKLLFFILILIIPFFINAKELKLDWEIIIDGDNTENSNDILYIEDYIYFFISSNSTEIDGIVNKGDTDVIFYKYDKEGNLIFKKNLGTTGFERVEKIIHTRNNEIIAIIRSQSLKDSSNIDALIVKLDLDGNVIWENSIGGSAFDRLLDVAELSDGSIIAVGYYQSNDFPGLEYSGGTDAFLVKYDKNGNLLWKKKSGGNKWDQYENIQVDEFDNFYVSIRSNSKIIDDISTKGSDDQIIQKYDKDGKLLWQNHLGGSGAEFIEGFMLTSHNELIVIINYNSNDMVDFENMGNSDIAIVKYNVDGNIVWKKYLSSTEQDYIKILNNDNDDNIYLFHYYISTSNELFAYIKKYNENGELILNKNVSSENAAFDAMFPIDKFGYITLGSANFETEDNKEYTNYIVTLFNEEGEFINKKNWGYFSPGVYAIHSTADNNSIYILNSFNSSKIEVDKHKTNKDAVIFMKYSPIYNLNVLNSENGEVEAVQNKNAGKISLKPNEGYEVDKVIVKDTVGNDLETTKLEDGTYSFELNDDVTIEVLFKEKLENPKTGMSDIIGLMFTVALCFISGFFVLKNYNKNYEL